MFRITYCPNFIIERHVSCIVQGLEIWCGNASSKKYKALVQLQAYEILVAVFLRFPGSKRHITLTRTLALPFRLQPTQLISRFACLNLMESNCSK